MIRLVFFFLLLMPTFLTAQKKEDPFADEKIALRFFLDSIYPVRPILDGKVLYTEGEIWPTNTYTFYFIIPHYREMKKLFNEEADYNFEHQIIPTFNKPKGRFNPRKWGMKRKNENCYRYPKQDSRENKKPRYPPSGFLTVYSMYYDSTKKEKLILVDVLVNGFSIDYQGASYAFVIKNKKIIVL